MYFETKRLILRQWEVPTEAYLESIQEGIQNPGRIPQWYFLTMMEDESGALERMYVTDV